MMDIVKIYVEQKEMNGKITNSAIYIKKKTA